MLFQCPALAVVERQWLQGCVRRVSCSTPDTDRCISATEERRHPESSASPLDPVQEVEVEEKEFKKFGKRRKFAVLLSYSGRGYMGMQKNPGIPTIEEDLITALRKALAFPECMENDHKKIRVMSVKRVTKSFDSRRGCVARRYEYLLPTYAFAPYHQSTPDYRLPDATVSLVNNLLARYEGTCNFHNFTRGLKFDDPSAKRVIVSFKSGDQFVGKNVLDANGKEIEFIPLRVKGQSFILHQIRKMIGFVIAIVQGLISEAEFERVFQEEKVDIPRAPALGLYLDNIYFDHYNARFCSNGERPKLEWQEVDAEICQFKKDYIHRTIIETEIKEMSMMSWLQRLQFHDFHQSARSTNADSAIDIGKR